METPGTTSIGQAVRDAVSAAGPDTLVQSRDFRGPAAGVESALGHLVDEGELVRVHEGLYWRGRVTRFGMTTPSPLELAITVAGPGSGPAGIAAAHTLGLTAQVPSIVEVAVPGPGPDRLPEVRFCARPYRRRLHALSPLEVAVLEVLRDPAAADVSWPDTRTRLAALMASSAARRVVILDEAAAESHRGARARASELAGTAGSSDPTGPCRHHDRQHELIA